MRELLEKYIGTLANAMRGAEVTDRASKKLTLESGCEWVRKAAHEAHNAGNKIIFIGNGGSAGIASHLAIDFSKNGGLRALAFNDPSALTCLGNDLGYENVFAKQLEFHARPGDVLIAISSSGMSPNILGAVKEARVTRLQGRDLFRVQRKQRVAAHRRRELLCPGPGQGIRLRRGRASGAVPCRARHRHGLGNKLGHRLG